jgi:hypothetical protein
MSSRRSGGHHPSKENTMSQMATEEVIALPEVDAHFNAGAESVGITITATDDGARVDVDRTSPKEFVQILHLILNTFESDDVDLDEMEDQYDEVVALGAETGEDVPVREVADAVVRPSK